MTWEDDGEIALRPIRVTTDMDMEYAVMTDAQVTTLVEREWRMLDPIPGMVLNRVDEVRDIAFVLWKRRHELKRATEELVLEERTRDSSGGRTWEEVATVYKTMESARGGAFVFHYTLPDGSRRLLYVQGMEVVDERAITTEQMIQTARRLMDARPEMRERAFENVPIGPRRPPENPPSTSSSSSSSSPPPRRGRSRSRDARGRRPAMRMLSDEPEQPDHGAMVTEDYEWMADEEDLEEETTRIAMRKATVENLYTPNIEALLKDLKENLKVVHTVDPAEALENLLLWIPAIQAELGSLDGFNAIERMKGKEARDFASSPTAKMVPGKLVFTVKPPSKEGEGYKRKVRMVSCGNHVEKDSSELYSAGVQAETVRLMVAIAAQKGYSLSVTDVKNAFLRAPLLDGAEGYGIRPPATLRRAGFVEDGEVWKALKAVYGFRQSPRWWGQHRDETLAAARWTRVEDNKTIYCGLMRTVTDGNLWWIRARLATWWSMWMTS